MGTNYYAILKEPPAVPLGFSVNDRLHVGKSSGGWAFALHVEPEKSGHPATLEEWRLLLSDPRIRIEDEYGVRLTAEEMASIIRDRQAPIRRSDGRHCIGHGKGPWDLIVGDFC